MNWDVNPESWVVLTSPHLDSAHPGNSRSGAVPASSFGSYRQRDRNLYKMHPTMEKCDQLFLAACTTYNIYIVYTVYHPPSIEKEQKIVHATPSLITIQKESLRVATWSPPHPTGRSNSPTSNWFRYCEGSASRYFSAKGWSFGNLRKH